ncbi:MAG: glycosyltransferase family 39 protein, partial [Candidatus Glassbacteria bacterium]|nr:glycosyltransferase family 39 protein [Candidatus Glassbacteria bacterium]
MFCIRQLLTLSDQSCRYRNMTAPVKTNRLLTCLGVAAGLAALIITAATVGDFGVTADEPGYYKCCLQQMEWFRQAGGAIASGSWQEPFGAETLDRYWDYSRLYRSAGAHPQFYLLCSSLTLALFEGRLDPMGAYRLSPAVMFSVLVVLLFLSVGRRYGAAAGFWAAGAFALMPRVFGHAHFGATEMPITLLWLAAALSFHRALGSRRWAVVFALVYGLALATKFTAFIIPLPLTAYVVASRRFREAAWPVGLALVVSPLVMVGLNPQWWHHPLVRVYGYLAENLSRSQWVGVPAYYLGESYSFYLPWHHSLVYTLFTVSPLVLAAFIYGCWRTARRPQQDPWAGHMLLHWLALHLVM